MNSGRAEFRGSPSSLPADHVLSSGAVIFPGVFDQHGCPLVVFPVEAQCKLTEELSKEEVSHFIHYCLRLHNIRGEESLVSVVVDLRQANLAIARFIAETLLLLEFSRRIIHSVYIVQPKKKDVLKQLGKLLTPNGSKQHRPVLFKRIFLKEVFELSNYIDRSQLTSGLGGYLIYCHNSWVAFVKEIDSFVQEFLLVVNRLPSCISTLQSLSKRPVPADLERLREFCCVNEARFQQLRRDLGLDDLLKQCEGLLEKLRFPENEPCFHAMAGTLLYTHTALEMLHNYNRITTAVEKVELLWQQAFSRAHVQLQVLRLQREAQQIQEQMVALHREKVQSYRIEVAKDAHRAEELRLEFETSIYTHAMALVRRAEDVVHTLAETVPLSERKPTEPWVEDLSRLKENLRSAVQHLHQTLRIVSDFHHTYNRCKNWYSLVLRESLLQELLWSGHCEMSSSPDLRSGLSSCRRGVEAFLRRNPCPEVQELVKLAHLSNVITDPPVRHTGTQLSHRCMTLRRLLTSPGAVPLHDLQLALQWQYEYLKGHQKTSGITSPEDERITSSLAPDSAAHAVSQCESLCDLSKWPSVADCHHQISSALGSAAGKPPSLSSFDSGFDGAGSSHLDGRSRRELLPRILVNGDSGDSGFKSKPLRGQIHGENIVSVSDSEDQREDLGFSLKRDSTHASIQIVPKITSDSLNLEIKVKRSATLPKNPWLSLPIDDLESSYTVTITPSSSNTRRDTRSPSFSECSDQARDRPAQTDNLGSARSQQHRSQDSFEELELNPMGNVLSSTLTDNEDKPSSTVDGDPSLLWDTFDLHNLRRDSYERLDASLGDWVQREQQELKEVEETLDRAAEILQEEENVLAQEVVLDELLRSEDLHKHWPLWTEGHQHSMMSPRELAESGVIGLDDVLQSDLTSLDSETMKSSEICEEDSDASGLSHKSPSTCEGPVQLDTRCTVVHRSGILRDLRDIEVLEEQIREEHLKLEALRCTETESLESEEPTLDHVTTRSSCRERRMFLQQLEQEKQEVEKMERNLSREIKKVNKVKKRSNKGRRVVKCSVMERNSKLKNLDDELRKCRLQQQQSPESLPDSDETPHTDTEKTTSDLISNAEECTRPNQAEDAELTDSTLTSEPVSSKSQPVSATSLGCPAATDSEFLQDVQSCLGEPDAESILSETGKLEAMDSSDIPSHLASTNVHAELSGDETSSCGCTDGDPAVDQAELKSGEAYSTQESDDVQGAFDPGGISITPVPTPRRVVQNDSVCNQEKRHASDSEAQVESGLSVISSKLMQNNNNNTAVLCSKEVPKNSCSSTVMPDDSRSLVVTGPCVGSDGVYDGGGSMRAACGSTLNQLQLHTSTRQMSDYKTPIILDTGSGLMKAGFADQDIPTTVFPTVIGRPKYEEVMNGSVDKELYVGHDAQHMRGVLTLKYPIRNGIVSNWDEMEMIWHHTFQQLCVSPEDHPVLLTEAAMNPLQNRQRMVELMFEAFSVPLTFVAVQAVLALYASGRTTGVVLDSGDGISHSVPVFEGYCLPHAVQRFDLAGSHVTLQLQKLLLEQGVCLRTSAELEIVREMKERCCCVALDYDAELKNTETSASEVHYTLPDGGIVSLATERFRAPEILFRPELIGRDHYGMHESVFRSILQSDIDLRRSFVGNILLSGGNTMLSGLPTRLQQEIRLMCPADLSTCVRVSSPSDRDFSVWCGGAALANMPDLCSAWISADEYEEFGPQIIFRKCF
ncbi:Actin cytoplasmic [Labeo rohita]|uniref:Actin cytoplasmic n=1 Tax=Labeo rohita TaxID=84645 RepID=A0A498LD26_LABRO|nr:Actin cytoplasmic [Labeo rohita]